MLQSSLSPSLSFHWVTSPRHTQLPSPALLLQTDWRRLKIIQTFTSIYINFTAVICLRNVYVANHFLNYHLLSRNIFCDSLSGIWNIETWGKKSIQSKLSTILTLKFNALIHHGPVWPVHLNLACIIDLNHVREVFQHHFIEVNFHKMAAHLHWFKLDAVSLRGGFSYLGINFLTRWTCKYL